MGIMFGKFTSSAYSKLAQWSYGGFRRFAERLGPQKPGSPLARLRDIEAHGEFTAAECAAIVPALVMLVVDWEHGDFDRIQVLKLVEQMKEAAFFGETLPYG